MLQHATKSLGVIGFGQFSQFFLPHLTPYFRQIVVIDKKPLAPAVLNPLGLEAGEKSAVLQQDILLLAIPTQAISRVLAEIVPHLRPGQWVVDVCSVKAKPVARMLDILPPNISVLGTHPLFGPQSGKNGIAGLPVILCPGRGGECQSFFQTLFEHELKLHVTQMPASEHDQNMAYVHALTHLVGRALIEMNIPSETAVQVGSYRHLLNLTRTIENDTWELFAAIQAENPYAPAVTKQFQRAVTTLLQRLPQVHPEPDLFGDDLGGAADTASIAT